MLKGMLAEGRLTRAAMRGEFYLRQAPPVVIKNPQLYVHPRSTRDIQCGCGFPRTPCVMGKKWDGWLDSPDDPVVGYTGNYCHVEQTEGVRG